MKGLKPILSRRKGTRRWYRLRETRKLTACPIWCSMGTRCQQTRVCVGVLRELRAHRLPDLACYHGDDMSTKRLDPASRPHSFHRLPFLAALVKTTVAEGGIRTVEERWYMGMDMVWLHCEGNYSPPAFLSRDRCRRRSVYERERVLRYLGGER
ncbi:hypothetical protein B0T20DRAFT_420605 [Sordaria brevicollis]|uniref:Uncharacterized protein n=1 Tax=Sordaria brevicollis TaxID=83679 RepID=A0AAE0P2U7_SORBR|nr:hypothetical protein B0T20DRAFT_420605 [Sordaria brevicollis]